MARARRPTVLLAALLLAPTLAACLTPRAKPEISQAVLEARSRARAPAGEACPQTPLSQVSPVMVGFAFDDATLPQIAADPLPGAATWLACHPQTPVVIKPDADVHGTVAEQDALARRRAEAVQAFLTARGIAASRIRLLPRGAAEPAGEHLLVQAEGRRW